MLQTSWKKWSKCVLKHIHVLFFLYKCEFLVNRSIFCLYLLNYVLKNLNPQNFMKPSLCVHICSPKFFHCVLFSCIIHICEWSWKNFELQTFVIYKPHPCVCVNIFLHWWYYKHTFCIIKDNIKHNNIILKIV